MTASWRSVLSPPNPLVLLLFALGACSRGEGALIATVGPATIREQEFQRRFEEVAPEYKNFAVTPEGRRQFLEVLLKEKLVLAAALESPVARSEAYRSEVAKFEGDLKVRLQEFKDYLLVKQWIESLRSGGTLAVGDAEVAEFHRMHPRQVELRHILLTTADEAQAVYEKARKGADFAGLARGKSVDAETAPEGGKLRPFLYGEFLPELSDVAFKMRVGEIAGPVRSQFGYHILRKEKESDLVLPAAGERIRRLLEKAKLDKHLDELRARYPVRIVDPKYK